MSKKTFSNSPDLISKFSSGYMPCTEVFTSNGWKLLKEIDNNDLVLSMNPETLETEFIKPLKIIKTKNDSGEMCRIYNKWFDICITFNHNCFILQRKMVNKVRQLISEFRKLNELNSESHFLKVCKNKNKSPNYININGLKFKSKDYAFILAWYLCEGSILHNRNSAKRRGYPVDIIQQIPENRAILESELKKITNYLGLKMWVTKDRFQIKSKELYDYFLPLGYSNEKYIPKELFSLSLKDLNIFLDNYVKGDGHERTKSNNLVSNSTERVIFTSSKKLANDLSYIILLAGFSPSFYTDGVKGKKVKFKNGTYIINNDLYRISINKSKKAFMTKLNIEKIFYDGYVYSLELPKYHTIWVCYNGKTCWNGSLYMK